MIVEAIYPKTTPDLPLLRSPKNAERLLNAISRAKAI